MFDWKEGGGLDMGLRILSSKEVPSHNAITYPCHCCVVTPTNNDRVPFICGPLLHGWRLEEMLKYRATNCMLKTSNEGLVDALLDLEFKEF